MLLIYTRTNKVFTKERLKDFLSVLSFRKRGPVAVRESLERGLRECGVKYKINPKYKSIADGDVVHVISGVNALREIVKIKSDYNNFKLLAGPTISVVPSDNDNLIMSKEIDAIITPSEWVKNMYIQCGTDSDKTFVWPSGVETPPVFGIDFKKDLDFLLYVKNVDDSLLEHVEKSLISKGLKYEKIIYGKFKRKSFFDLLEISNSMIYLSPSESQGLALNEAWIRDVPTLVWDKGFWKHSDFIFNSEKISCPYLSKETGITFNSVEDFDSKLGEFQSNLQNFSPREHSLNNFTDKKSAEILLDIIAKISI